jgi:hypothetical protein
MTKTKTFPKNFQKVVDYISEKMGIRVELTDSTCFLGHQSKLICIHRSYNLEKNGLYALLHECGHALQPITNIGVNCYRNIDEDEKPKEFSMKRFINEVDAWDKGLLLSKKLNIKIDIKEFEKVKDLALLTYFTVS